MRPTTGKAPTRRTSILLLLLAAGSSITFRCDYLDATDFTLSFGESTATNEMCILSGVFYPSPNGQGIVCM